MNKLISDRLNKRPAKKGYHPNVSPYKVIVHPENGEPYIKREYTTKEKAERYAMQLSMKYKRMRITIEYMRTHL